MSGFLHFASRQLIESPPHHICHPPPPFGEKRSYSIDGQSAGSACKSIIDSTSFAENRSIPGGGFVSAAR